MISRERATEIAREVIRDNALGAGVRQTLLLSEMRFRAPSVYGVDLSKCWIAYAETANNAMISSSTIVAIDRDAGAVVYKGSAYDEG